MQLAVSADIEQPARSIIGTSTKGIAVGEELNRVDVGVVSSKSLTALLLSDVPELSKGIASTGHELVVVERVNAQTHDVAQVVCKFCDLLAGLDVPEHASHVAGRGKDAAVVDETAARQVAGVPTKLPCHSGGAFSRAQVVDGANVVETTASHVVAAWRVSAGHDPRRAQRNRVDLVGSVGIPNDELAILGRGNKVSPVG